MKKVKRDGIYIDTSNHNKRVKVIEWLHPIYPDLVIVVPLEHEFDEYKTYVADIDTLQVDPKDMLKKRLRSKN